MKRKRKAKRCPKIGGEMVPTYNPKTAFKGPIPPENALLFIENPQVGARVCVHCLMLQTGKGGGLIKPSHTFVEGVCRFRAPGIVRYEPGEEAYLAQQKKLDKVVPF